MEIKILQEVTHLLCVIFKRANPPQKKIPNDGSLQYSYRLKESSCETSIFVQAFLLPPPPLSPLTKFIT